MQTMTTAENYLATRGKANRPNKSGSQQITHAEKIILLPAEDYFQNRDRDTMDYRGLYVGIAYMQDLFMPIQSTKHYWLSADINKAKRAIRKVNIDVLIEVMDFSEFISLRTSSPKEPHSILDKIKRSIEREHWIPLEIKRVFYLLKQGEKINVILDVGDKGYSIAFIEYALIGYSHVTDDALNILYFDSADEAIKLLEPIKMFINCRIMLRFSDIARISPSKA